ncbi:UDP-3-O-(3-hydroxymyristoyl)glucosamine N-acyltransferase [Sulfitobacter pseudonitzschiae]|uniref:UDP-3-O-(3-hydroxymyristoyl)glucosamine N-acyltransferase n=1 Tax=Pseudosulfitobacter pseudonitzschiae TaxID=1402135 RepID=A0A9Q2NPG0_9RHOB|nr:UDP-3-O-(3-hydroxymyristoyl)glucosamine N-acyltransferase [Pseudosulfitobacter pseudonitzschiae]MBM2293892.1 UDP-3-O-(3-hydroxymyristoyl)glucosamine N-acyltransferase [Pseudosulfitobacter pseudonitzschiae]MBM2298809.1 UDP-3-O-(3-hydroxymyristoyl)glucosamine N-acyltransferase [Pseudosulfitobacter pseudonitzschiae]MBM2303723.1 UDP-3-O-(3-hydroxymyristoyl)glucosamine N-acyltransferase [Pseudosulfitobacter pseudonitzschiae]MBM2313506.1 UDP-3-O-(3-hydroxymyristoyl)glucosamine N-acyltransferase [P
MSYTVKEIAAALGAEAFGAVDLLITGVHEPALATADQLAMATSAKYAENLSKGAARAAVLWQGADWQALGLEAAIVPARPRFAMSGLTRMMDRGQGFGTGIHPTAVIDPTAEIGADVSIGPLCVVMAGARIGAGSVIGPQCFIGTQAVLGAEAYLREQVSIGAYCQIGDRFVAQPGGRVGPDGFSFVTPEVSGAEQARASLGADNDAKPQAYARIHSLGAVVIGDDVELGANSTIDNGTIRATRIGNGTKIDNQVQVGHNCVIGNDTLLCAGVGVAGSTVVGNNVVLGGMTGVGDNLTIGDRVICGGGTKVLSSVPAGRVMLGYPATRMETQLETYKALRRLPRLFRDVAALQKTVFKSDNSD